MNLPSAKIDLHVHSSASDGSEPPEKIPILAKEAGVTAVALTDHDTVSGIEAFMAAGRDCGIETIPGVEISTKLFRKEIHIVGLFIDPKSDELNALMKKMREARELRNELIIKRLQAAGYDISIQAVRDCAGGESIGRPHIAQSLVQKGYVESIPEAFNRFLKRGCSIFVPRELPDARDAVPVIHAAHGIAVWAHPVSGQSGERAYVRKMLHALCGFGLDGIEAYYSAFTQQESALMKEIAADFHLCCSGGSDFHGARRAGVLIGSGGGGLSVPGELLEPLRLAAQKYKRQITPADFPFGSKQ